MQDAIGSRDLDLIALCLDEYRQVGRHGLQLHPPMESPYCSCRANMTSAAASRPKPRTAWRACTTSSSWATCARQTPGGTSSWSCCRAVGPWAGWCRCFP